MRGRGKVLINACNKMRPNAPLWTKGKVGGAISLVVALLVFGQKRAVGTHFMSSIETKSAGETRNQRWLNGFCLHFPRTCEITSRARVFKVRGHPVAVSLYRRRVEYNPAFILCIFIFYLSFISMESDLLTLLCRSSSPGRTERGTRRVT